MKNNLRYAEMLGSLILLLSLALSGCSSLSRKAPFESGTGFSIMAYNVENLFDTVNDEGVNDITYLPLHKKQTEAHQEACAKISVPHFRQECLELDWSDEVLDLKMRRLTDVVLQIDGGRGPDLLLLSEVENRNVLELWRDRYLQAAEYETIVWLPGFDRRGIDVAMMSRWPQVGEPILHRIPFTATNPREEERLPYLRGILQATFLLPDGHHLTAFAVHLPNPRNPRHWREEAIDFMIQLVSQLPPDHLYVFGGDFNISGQEESRYGLYSRSLAPHFLVSHIEGCRRCKGSNYFPARKQWSFLDALIFDPRMSLSGEAPWVLDPKSIRIPTGSRYQVSRFGTPARFDHESPFGVSDHWPIKARIHPRRAESRSR